MFRLSANSGASASRNPKGISRPVAGKLYLCINKQCPGVTKLMIDLSEEINISYRNNYTSVVCLDLYTVHVIF
jgi:hypothetical protein